MHYSDQEIEELLSNKNFPALKNSRILQAAKGEVPDKLPIWIMRQAGRYLPEFREFRKKHSFFDICQSPRLACEVTLMPIRRYELDAAIIFSDILVIPQALGLEVVMEPEKGPVFPHPLTLDTLNDLKWDRAVDRLVYVGQAISLTRHALEGKVPLVGFSAAPWTLMVYMIEGGGTKTASKTKRWIYAHEDKSKKLIEQLTQVIIDYLVMQVQHGAQMLQVFESSAEYLNSNVYKEFLLPSVISIHSGVNNKLKSLGLDSVPIVFFAKGGGHFIDLQLATEYEVIGVDWVTKPAEVRKINDKKTLQGNLDPCVLYADKPSLEKYALKMMNDFGYNRYIVNLGHGIYPDANVDAVKWLVDAVHAYKSGGN